MHLASAAGSRALHSRALSITPPDSSTDGAHNLQVDACLVTLRRLSAEGSKDTAYTTAAHNTHRTPVRDSLHIHLTHTWRVFIRTAHTARWCTQAAPCHQSVNTLRICSSKVSMPGPRAEGWRALVTRQADHAPATPYARRAPRKPASIGNELADPDRKMPPSGQLQAEEGPSRTRHGPSVRPCMSPPLTLTFHSSRHVARLLTRRQVRRARP